MKKNILLALALSLALMLSACGTPSNSVSSDNGTDDTPSAAVPDNTPSNDASVPGDSVTDDFLKTITAETAEAKGVCGANLTWYYQDNVLVVKGTGKMTDYTSYENTPWREYRNEIGWIIIGDGVTSIGEFAFSSCGAMLSNVVFPETLEVIGRCAFTACHGIKDITFPKSLAYIGSEAFDTPDDHMSVTFLGDAPDTDLWPFSSDAGDNTTIYYSGSGFDGLIGQNPYINWVKQ